MKAYIISLGVGVLVGVIYSLLHVRSPAPPLPNLNDFGTEPSASSKSQISLA